MMRYHLGLGSNLGRRDEQLSRALDLLKESGLRILKISSIYETEPVGPHDQSWFLNQAVEAETALAPLELLALIKDIELRMGRVNSGMVRNAPRNIDIDILLAEETVISLPDLTIPHPRFPERNFVLFPLREIASEIRHPVLGHTIETLWRNSSDPSIVNLHTLYR